MRSADSEGSNKAAWRAWAQAGRAANSAEHGAEAAALAAMATSLPEVTPGAVVCAYLPFGTEPATPALPDALVAAGARVLLPVVPPQRGPLDWAEYRPGTALASGRLSGLREPAGDTRGPGAIAGAGLVLVPALAVDHRGVRLGRGAGYYDRSLPLAAPGTALVAVVRDAELVPQLPADAHDVAMTGALMPRAGFVALPASGSGDPAPSPGTEV